jgi:hypothetical protein
VRDVDHRKPELIGCDEESERVAYRVLSHAKSREDQRKCGCRTPDTRSAETIPSIALGSSAPSPSMNTRTSDEPHGLQNSGGNNAIDG